MFDSVSGLDLLAPTLAFLFSFGPLVSPGVDQKLKGKCQAGHVDRTKES